MLLYSPQRSTPPFHVCVPFFTRSTVVRVCCSRGLVFQRRWVSFHCLLASGERQQSTENPVAFHHRFRDDYPGFSTGDDSGTIREHELLRVLDKSIKLIVGFFGGWTWQAISPTLVKPFVGSAPHIVSK
jgi:hypothetical protein